ncbi:MULTISPECIES: hypothetical protein [Xanthomonas]|nr:MULTISPECIES: hypothetical protein [Xanthomonas]MDN0277043.1 hypothetical protein [Xanthomonas arboricola pv. juglandis]
MDWRAGAVRARAGGLPLALQLPLLLLALLLWLAVRIAARW